MQFLTFLRDNARWLGGAFLLTFFSIVGQTTFIALSAGHIRREFDLSNGDWGVVYMIGTLGSALTLPYLGQIVDRFSVRKVVLLVLPMLALGRGLDGVREQRCLVGSDDLSCCVCSGRACRRIPPTRLRPAGLPQRGAGPCRW